MIIKLISAAAIIISCSYVGFKLSNNLYKRVHLLSNILAAVSKIESCITTVRMPLSEIYSLLSSSKGTVGEFFSKLTPDTDWAEHIDILNGLAPQDKSAILGLSEKLGSLDYERQIDELRFTQNLLISLLDKAKSDMNENSKVYKSMSFFTGVVIAVLLI